MKSRTQNSFKRIGLCVALVAPLIFASGYAQAAWPEDRPITMVIPYAPGGATDTLGRAISKSLSEQLGQTIIVENRPGAGSMMALNTYRAPSPTATPSCWAASRT